ncbi:XrtA-associated tyrosine autokinase [Emcibacter nanhaiensis]|uniref:non-specific protein-tyrosine kinase n=1 Tax=Emcibacter nanhaiensis TaxID=1505037 RepID=A0A501PAC8_9PROT|nr:XrtA-associated tyrosine autokinase [Emcibacter nanhaiensis]TPD57329.1 protein tyrosine kinase [Emcibacter nanhaiensis]
MSLIEKAAEKMKKTESLVEKAARKAAENSAKAEPAAQTSANQVASETPAPAPAPEKPVQAEPVAQAEPMAEPQAASAPVSRSHGRRSRHVDINFDELRAQNIPVLETDHSIISEEFRIVKRSLLLNAFAKGDAAIKNGNIIMVTSTQPDEGKTFCAVSLAMSMAMERDLTVLLIDADVEKPDVMKRLGVKADKGLIDVIEDKSLDLSDCLLRTNIPNLSLLPAGKKHRLTTELLASERMGEIVDEVAKRYPDRVIIIDSPPVLASSSASVLALSVGQVLYVVEADKTREIDLKEALSMIGSCEHINLLLNKSRFSGGKKKFGSYYGYGHH